MPNFASGNKKRYKMKPTAIFYGSTSGNCESIARKIGEALGVGASDIYSASELDAAKLGQYDNLLLGSSTWGCGDLQDEWYDAVEVLKGADLSGKQVAVFGCGDSCGFGSTFCNAMATIYDAAKGAGATMIGDGVDAAGYSFDDSEAVRDGKFVGLALDEDNESDLTDSRIAAWVGEIAPKL